MSPPRCGTIFFNTICTTGNPMDIRKLQRAIVDALEDVKAQDIKVFNTSHLTGLFDRVIVASGTSDRHVRSIAESVIQKAKEAGRRPLGTEGARDAEWVLVDLQDVLVHVMLPRVREFYALEQLWEVPAAARRASGAPSQPRTRSQRGTRRPARRGAAGRGQGR